MTFAVVDGVFVSGNLVKHGDIISPKDWCYNAANDDYSGVSSDTPSYAEDSLMSDLSESIESQQSFNRVLVYFLSSAGSAVFFLICFLILLSSFDAGQYPSLLFYEIKSLSGYFFGAFAVLSVVFLYLLLNNIFLKKLVDDLLFSDFSVFFQLLVWLVCIKQFWLLYVGFNDGLGYIAHAFCLFWSVILFLPFFSL